MTLMDGSSLQYDCEAAGQAWPAGGALTAWRPAPAAHLTETFADCSAYVLGDTGGLLLPALAALGWTALTIDVDVNVWRGLARVGRDARALQLVLVDIDGLGSLGAAVDALRRFRRRHPLAVVLIASRHFRRSDLSQERFTIADASIRLPASPRLLAEALRAALGNNIQLLHVC